MEDFKRGIGIFTTGRAGSSMIAGIFASHGVWHGKDRMQPSQWNAKGFFQNGEIHKSMKDFYGRDIEGEPPVHDIEWDNQLKAILKRQGATYPWFIKTGTFYHPVWKNLVDKQIMIRRPLDKILDSYKRCNFLPEQKWNVEFIVKRQLEMMDKMEGVTIDTERVVLGDFSQLKEAFDYCGLEFKPEIAEDFVDKDLYSI